MGKIHCSTCTCEESSRPRTGEFSCPNCSRPNNSEGWLRWHLKNQCEVSPAREREEEPQYTRAEWQGRVELGLPNRTSVTAEEWSGGEKTNARKPT